MTILDTNNKATSLRVDASGRLMVIPSGGGSTAANLAIGVRTATSLPITNSSGTGVDLPIATTSLAGTLSAADKTKLDTAVQPAALASYLPLAGGIVTGTLGVNGFLTVGTTGAGGVLAIKRASDGATVGSLSHNASASSIEISSGTEIITFKGSSAESMRLSSGHLGLGVTPVPIFGNRRVLHLSDTANGADIRVSGSGGGEFSLTSAGGATYISAWGTTPANSAIIFSNGGSVPAGATEKARIDSAGNIGQGTIPSAWDGDYVALQQPAGSLWSAKSGAVQYLSQNLFYDGSTYRTKQAAAGSTYYQTNGTHVWQTAIGAGAGLPATPVENMRLDLDGNLLVGPTSGTHHAVRKLGPVGTNILSILDGNAGTVATFVSVDNGTGSANAALAAQYLGKYGSTNRSLNAGGTINASGADYAEYERNNGHVFAKGAIVGFRTDGTLTDIFSAAVRFGIKSTDPSLVGGDTWGNEQALGPRPDPEDEVATAAYEDALEAARKNVDRVAYSGKVPVNVYGAEPGQYIVAVKAASGGIEGRAVPKGALSFSDYQDAVGRVNRILPDGRAEVAVIIH